MSVEDLTATRIKAIPYESYRLLVIQFNLLLRELKLMQGRQHALEQRLQQKEVEMNSLRKGKR